MLATEGLQDVYSITQNSVQKKGIGTWLQEAAGLSFDWRTIKEMHTLCSQAVSPVYGTCGTLAVLFNSKN
jgi:uncharacterized membrane protein